jgi:ribosomal protein S5
LTADNSRNLSWTVENQLHRFAIEDALPIGAPNGHLVGCGYGEPNAVANAIDYAKFRSRSHHAVIRVYNKTGNVIDTHEHKG